ncbi:unnamed protein product [Miscanthus lutarioriparius]|uniref:Knottins-like domain-containing protein n=1 Tax=Miscanthus lutarioriparius TaxID=422564 RepID=A0A811PES9_9POAL|nr:unnamed protein product [Miscanthus lutarioriparius]
MPAFVGGGCEAQSKRAGVVQLRRGSASVLVLLLLLVATELGTTTVAEARYCLSQSHRFKGLRMSCSNCANVCQTENFPGGECKADGV